MKKILISVLVLLCGALSAQNHWTPNMAPYEDYMTLFVVLQIDGVEETSTDYEIGAFCGEECRGSTVALYIPPLDRYLYQLPVYGNLGDAIIFRLYDRVQEMELTGYETDDLMYVTEGYGSGANPYTMNFIGGTPTPPSFVLVLTPGWNWISYLLLDTIPIEEALVHLTPNDGDIIKGQEGVSYYQASTHEWVGSLRSLIPGRGYMYYNNNNTNNSFYYPILD